MANCARLRGQSLLQAAKDLFVKAANGWISDGVNYVHPILAAGENAGVSQNLKVAGRVRLAQTRGGDQLRNVFLSVFDSQDQSQPAGFSHCAKARGNQLNGFARIGLARNLLLHSDASRKLRLNNSICAYNCIVKWT